MATERPSVRRTVMPSDRLGRPSRAVPAIRSERASTAASPRPATSAIPTLPCTKAVATRKGWANWASTTWVGRRLAGALAELVGVAGGIGLDRHRFDVIGPRDPQRRARRQGRVDRRVQRAAAGIGLVAQRLPAKHRAQILQKQRGVVPVRLVQLEEPEAAVEDVVRPGEPGLRQNRGEHAGARRLAGLHALGQCPVEDALAVAGGMAVGDAEGMQRLLCRQPHQFAGRGRGAEHPDRGGTVPAAVQGAGEGDAARYVQAQRHRQQDIPSVNAG